MIASATDIDTDILLYQIALTLIPDIGAIRAKNLMAYCGSAEAVFKEKEHKLLKIPGVGALLAKQVANADVLARAEKEIGFIIDKSIRPVFFTDVNYPKRLKQCEDSPILLYYKGNADLNHQRVVSIVGTRNATDYGKSSCENLLAELAEMNVLVVSGLAYGIDICAHRAALDKGLETIGVLGHGLDRVYPSQHKATAQKMLAQGGLLSEFISGTNPDRENFPKRNRIVAGLSDAVIVIEAAVKGGALITAELANMYNRDVFAVPGKIGDTFSEGCNRLIKTNKAALIESAKDVAYLLGWSETTKKNATAQTQLFHNLTADEELIVAVLKVKEKTAIDELCIQSNFTMSKTATLLLNLEFAGVIKSLPGKLYKLNT